MSCKKETLPIILVAAAALIDKDGSVLIARRAQGRSMAGLWEFPGGKIEEGETPEYALMRELEEELGIKTREDSFFPVGFSSHSYERFHILMPLFVCRVWEGEPVALEHSELRWVKAGELCEYEMPKADIVLIPQLAGYL